MTEDVKKLTKQPKVAKIISNSQLVISAGKKDGVDEGDVFQIVELGDEVFDPDTGESLGSYEITKGKGKVVQCLEKLSIVEPPRGYNSGIGILAIAMEGGAFKDVKEGDVARLID